jgi:hypothetical protein
MFIAASADGLAVSPDRLGAGDALGADTGLGLAPPVQAAATRASAPVAIANHVMRVELVFIVLVFIVDRPPLRDADRRPWSMTAR